MRRLKSSRGRAAARGRGGHASEGRKHKKRTSHRALTPHDVCLNLLISFFLEKESQSHLRFTLLSKSRHRCSTHKCWIRQAQRPRSFSFVLTLTTDRITRYCPMKCSRSTQTQKRGKATPGGMEAVDKDDTVGGLETPDQTASTLLACPNDLLRPEVRVLHERGEVRAQGLPAVLRAERVGLVELGRPVLNNLFGLGRRRTDAWGQSAHGSIHHKP